MLICNLAVCGSLLPLQKPLVSVVFIASDRYEGGVGWIGGERGGWGLVGWGGVHTLQSSSRAVKLLRPMWKTSALLPVG